MAKGHRSQSQLLSPHSLAARISRCLFTRPSALSTVTPRPSFSGVDLRSQLRERLAYAVRKDRPARWIATHCSMLFTHLVSSLLSMY